MCTGLKIVTVTVVLTLAVACGSLSGETPTSSAVPIQATIVPGVEATSAASPMPMGAGYGGLFLDREDNSIVYVYLLNPSQKAAESAAFSALGQRRFERIREVRALQGQYTITQLNEWDQRMLQDARIWVISEITISGVSEGRNRISIGVNSNEDVEKVQMAVETVLADLGIPREAVVIRVVPRPTPLAS